MSRVEHDDPESLSIGEVSGLSGKAASAIRYYEQVGLVDVPSGSAAAVAIRAAWFGRSP
jgi:hypothetical protein